MLVTDSGKIIRLRVAELRVIGRNTQGVKLFNVGADGHVSSLALVAEGEVEEEVEEEVAPRGAENGEEVLNSQRIEEQQL
jgi:DNA gyrase subunit A